jgi:hypothetical protein
VSLVDLPVPREAPPKVLRIVRRARVGRALGPGIADHLVDVRSGRHTVLVFQGREWLHAFDGCREETRLRLEQALGHGVDGFEVQVQTPRSGGRPRAFEGTGAAAVERPPEENLEVRLARIGRRLADRRDTEPLTGD